MYNRPRYPSLLSLFCSLCSSPSSSSLCDLSLDGGLCGSRPAAFCSIGNRYYRQDPSNIIIVIVVIIITIIVKVAVSTSCGMCTKVDQKLIKGRGGCSWTTQTGSPSVVETGGIWFNIILFLKTNNILSKTFDRNLFPNITTFTLWTISSWNVWILHTMSMSESYCNHTSMINRSSIIFWPVELVIDITDKPRWALYKKRWDG